MFRTQGWKIVLRKCECSNMHGTVVGGPDSAHTLIQRTLSNMIGHRLATLQRRLMYPFTLQFKAYESPFSSIECLLPLDAT